MLIDVRFFSGFLLIIAMSFVTSCNYSEQSNTNPDKTATMQSITQGEKNVMLSNGSIVVDSAIKLIKQYQIYQEHWPDDSLSSEYLFKAIEISINLPRPAESLTLVDTYLKYYPETFHAGVALFMKGFIYDQQLNDTANARLAYEKLIEEYSDHAFADDAQSAINFLGKSPEELIRSFEQQQN
jgi:tetratricopeptide (TPR) repeat protein